MYNIHLLIFKRHMTIHRDTLLECMREFKIPAKLINTGWVKSRYTVTIYCTPTLCPTCMCKMCTKDKKCS